MKRIWGIALFVGVGLLFAGVSEAKTVQHRVKCRPGYVRRTVWVPERRHGRIVRSYGMIVYARVQRCVKVNKPKPPSPPPVSVSTTGATLLPSPFAPIGSPSPFAPPSPSPSPSPSPKPPSPPPPPPPSPPPPSSGDPVVVAVGDIACPAGDSSHACQQGVTAKLAQSFSPTAVLVLGDNQYDDGLFSEYEGAGAYNATWGAFNPIVDPVPGNHEYGASTSAAGYFQYFGALAHPPAGYYSFNIGTWHIAALNSDCSNSGCADATYGATSAAQLTWLQSDLAQNTRPCVLAMWHHPLVSSGWTYGSVGVAPLWNALYSAHADVVLNGHDHLYERYAQLGLAQTANPVQTAGLDPNGIREFVVGTGGESKNGLSSIGAQPQASDSQFGVLVLTLHAGSYDWKFVNTGGTTVDSGTTPCHRSVAGASIALAARAAKTSRLALSGPPLALDARPQGSSVATVLERGLPVAIHLSRAADVTVNVSVRRGHDLRRIASFYETESEIPGPYSRILLHLPARRLSGVRAVTLVLQFVAVDSDQHRRVETTTVSLRSR